MQNIWSGLLPKSETQSMQFLSNNPQWDGRGVIVGVLDTGVDPGAIGLQQTTQGTVKVIDIIDCTGSGDILLQPPCMASEDHSIPGIGNRKLYINPAWNNPTGKYRVGVKALYDLYPDRLKERVSNHRKKMWSREHEKAEWQLQNSKTEQSDEDLQARISVLRSMGKDVSDPGPIVDCIVFHDGEVWQAAIDCSGTGDLSKVEPMTDYRRHNQYRRFSEDDALNYCVNIHDDGSVLSIVTDAGAHGTHVAGIISAFHPENPECNGVAPGAQIVSLKIGDSRLGSMETGPGLVRALIEAVKRGCHVINMSYGEAATWDNEGVFVRLAEELVHKHGIIFVSSAGNNGPCLSTVGAPGGTSSCMISVGALVTQSLMKAAYSMKSSVPDTNFTWSSVGPATDGDMGVTVLAPGGAITCVPNWTLNKTQLMNGTSMSSPNACGCIALLLSAAHASNIHVPDTLPVSLLSPARLRMAIENSALMLSRDAVDTLGQHHGVLQVENAWEHIVKNQSDSSVDIPLRVTVKCQRFKRGIYLRQPSEVATAQTFVVQVDPIFHENETADTKIHYEMRLHVESSASWVTCPEYMLLAQSGKVMKISVDPTGLPVGEHFVEFVRGYDENNREKGPVFEVPITVIMPEVVPALSKELRLGVIELPETQRLRKFIVPPQGCTFIDVIITDERLFINPADGCDDESDHTSKDSSARMIVMHALQLMPGQPYRDNEKQSYINLTPGSTHCVSFSVTEGVTVEMVLARFWSTLGDVKVNVVLNFRGVIPSVNPLCISNGNQVSDLVTLAAELETVSIDPTSKLDKWQTTIQPLKKGEVTSLGERDVLPSGTPLYQLLLEYSFKQRSSGSITPRWPGLNDMLYESPFHGQFYMIYDSRKCLIGTGDAWPRAVSIKKGDHTVRIQIRHESPSVLEGLSQLPMVLERSLTGNGVLKLTCHKSKMDALLDVALPQMDILRGTSQSLVWKAPSPEKYPKGTAPGDIFIGTVNYMKSSSNASGSGCRPGGFKVQFIVSSVQPENVSSKADSSKTNANNDTAEVDKEVDKLKEVSRQALVRHLEGIVGNEKNFDRLYEAVLAEYPDYVPLRLLRLSHLMKVFYRGDQVNDVQIRLMEEAISCADGVVSLIDQNAIALELGTCVGDDGAAKARRREVEKQRDHLVSALSLKCHALINIAGIQNCVSGGVESVSDVDSTFDSTYKELKRWENPATTDSNWRLHVHSLKLSKRFGEALKRINDLIAKPLTTDSYGPSDTLKYLEKERSSLMRDLGWDHISRYLSARAILSSVDQYLPF